MCAAFEAFKSGQRRSDLSLAAVTPRPGNKDRDPLDDKGRMSACMIASCSFRMFAAVERFDGGGEGDGFECELCGVV